MKYVERVAIVLFKFFQKDFAVPQMTITAFLFSFFARDTEFFWSVFSRIWTEYEEILRISPYSVRTQKNTDQKTPRLGTFHPDDYRTKIIMNQEIFQNVFHGVSHQSCLLNRNSRSGLQPSDLQLY